MQFITRQLLSWPRPVTKKRNWGDYGIGYEKCLRLLERELEHLGVTGDVIIQLDMPETSLRRDGLPYSDRRPDSPKVAIAFTSKHGPMTYYCDAHHEWQENVRAIVLGLERLRLVERTGIISRGEQYKGFKQLGSGIEMPAPAMTVEEAALQLAVDAAPLVAHIIDPKLRFNTAAAGAAAIMAAPAAFQTVYRVAAKNLHPDAGGTRAEWDRLQAAADVLKKHHGIS